MAERAESLGRVHESEAGKDKLRTKIRTQYGFQAVLLICITCNSRNISSARKRFLAFDDCY